LLRHIVNIYWKIGSLKWSLRIDVDMKKESTQRSIEQRMFEKLRDQSFEPWRNSEKRVNSPWKHSFESISYERCSWFKDCFELWGNIIEIHFVAEEFEVKKQKSFCSRSWKKRWQSKISIGKSCESWYLKTLFYWGAQDPIDDKIEGFVHLWIEDFNKSLLRLEDSGTLKNVLVTWKSRMY